MRVPGLLRIDPTRFRAGCRKRRLNPGLVLAVCQVRIKANAGLGVVIKIKGKKVKVRRFMQRVHCSTLNALRYGSHSFTCRLPHTLPLPRKRSPDGATNLIAAYYSSIDPKRMAPPI